MPFLTRPRFIAAACRQTDRPVCIYMFTTRMTTLHTLRPGGSRLSGRIRPHFLACEDIDGGSQLSRRESYFLLVIWMHFLVCEDVADGSQQSGGFFFHEIWWPVWWVPAVRWRNHYFARNKEALPCCGRGPSCQPLHVQYSSDASRSLTTLTTSRQEHQGG